jgi:hypothetical protein
MLAGKLVSLDVNDHEIVRLGDDQGRAGPGRSSSIGAEARS